jgi:mRNA interferase RelE/StbE
MVYKIIIEKKPLKVLETLPLSEKNKVLKEIQALAENPRKYGVIKLKDSDPSQYRTRQGNYRIVFEIKDDILVVLVIRIFIRGDEY